MLRSGSDSSRTVDDKSPGATPPRHRAELHRHRFSAYPSRSVLLDNHSVEMSQNHVPARANVDNVQEDVQPTSTRHESDRPREQMQIIQPWKYLSKIECGDGLVRELIEKSDTSDLQNEWSPLVDLGSWSSDYQSNQPPAPLVDPSNKETTFPEGNNLSDVSDQENPVLLAQNPRKARNRLPRAVLSDEVPDTPSSARTVIFDPESVASLNSYQHPRYPPETLHLYLHRSNPRAPDCPRPIPPRRSSRAACARAVSIAPRPIISGHPRQEPELSLKKEYLVTLCRILLQCGAPTHRIEEYLQSSAHALGIKADFQYLPHSVIVVLADPKLGTNEVYLIKETMYSDFSKTQDAYQVGKKVISGVYSLNQGLQRLNDIVRRQKSVRTAILIPLYGIATLAVGSFAFGARPIDFGLAFTLGCIGGIIQYLIAPWWSQSPLLFDVIQSMITSFISRALGSIVREGEHLFCFAALAQSSVVLILPGQIILYATEELQNKNIVAGSMRFLYAIISTLAVAFGILLGMTAFGLIYPDATSATHCNLPYYWDSQQVGWELLYTRFIWVLLFSTAVGLLNQAKWQQLPVMLFIAGGGYQASYWSSLGLDGNVQIANFLGAFVVGALSNIYARISHDEAATVMLPAIFVQLPNALSANMSLLTGVVTADNIVANTTGRGTPNDILNQFSDVSTSSTAETTGSILSVGFTMAQFSTIISVGITLSTLIIYPRKSKRGPMLKF